MTEAPVPNESAAEALAARFPAASGLGLRFRRMDQSDLPFLERLYASTRAEELAPVPWPEEEKAAFVAQQFRAQHQEYMANYPRADWLVVEHGGAAVGRLYLHRQPDQHGIIDIALLPQARRKGFGAAMMEDVLAEAAAAGKPVRIYVEKYNPAKRLYARLGFRPIAESGVYDLLEWGPEP
jgi:ribosomal protein S18 acetylase RimI-like enzyme